MRIFRKRAYIPPLFMLLAATLCLLGTPHWANASEPETHTFSPEEIAKLEEVKRELTKSSRPKLEKKSNSLTNRI